MLDLFDVLNNLDEQSKSQPYLEDHILNSYKYGFILRYPKGKEEITGFNFEPWHFRYVGLELAEELHENNQVLEEYYELKKQIKI